MIRKFCAIAIFNLAVCGWAIAADHSSNVTIMTQNMDDGTDQTYIVLASLPTPLLPLATAVDLTAAELQASNFKDRNTALAIQIAGKKPELVALQEASLWRTGPSPANATIPLFDQIALLLTALSAQGVPYDLVAVNTVNDLALPGDQVKALRLTERNALLMRSDLRPPGLHLSDVHSHLFKAQFPFGQNRISAGWIEATVHTGNKQFRLIATHLQTAIPIIPEAKDVQVAQAQELIHELRNVTIPVVICGDFNSDATHSGYGDDTPSVDLIQTAGYKEIWGYLHSGDPGLTWPLYAEDLIPPPPFVGPAPAIERIDLFFARDLNPIGIEKVLSPTTVLTPPPPAYTPPYGSDHAGVLAEFQP